MGRLGVVGVSVAKDIFWLQSIDLEVLKGALGDR